MTPLARWVGRRGRAWTNRASAIGRGGIGIHIVICTTSGILVGEKCRMLRQERVRCESPAPQGASAHAKAHSGSSESNKADFGVLCCSSKELKISGSCYDVNFGMHNSTLGFPSPFGAGTGVPQASGRRDRSFWAQSRNMYGFEGACW